MSTHFLLGVFLLLCCSVSGMNSYYVLTGWRPVSYSHLHHACMPLEYIVLCANWQMSCDAVMQYVVYLSGYYWKVHPYIF